MRGIGASLHPSRTGFNSARRSADHGPQSSEVTIGAAYRTVAKGCWASRLMTHNGACTAATFDQAQSSIAETNGHRLLLYCHTRRDLES
jgi:hypothetical protein